jgi:3-methyladenine DNA glycosylase AlkC
MAQALKDQYDFKFAQTIANQIYCVYPEFEKDLFLKNVEKNYYSFELLPRAEHIATNLNKFLPAYYPDAIKILIDSMGNILKDDRSFGIDSFLYMPHSYYISLYGLDYFDESMEAMYQLTQRFTAEFCIRFFIQKYPEKTIKKLLLWAKDESFHVRRLTSEGTRPRLPWANQLKTFIHNPKDILPILKILQDDKELYVRRSVANNLNDISKDNPDITIDFCKKLVDKTDKNKMWLINHALRTMIKKGNKEALSLLGFQATTQIEIRDVKIPTKAFIGDSIYIEFSLLNIQKKKIDVLVDFSIDYKKANNKNSNKIFKLKTTSIKANQSSDFRKKISLQEMTTRKHYEGEHQVFVHINGEVFKIGSFELYKK